MPFSEEEAATTGLSLAYLFNIATPLQYAIQRFAEVEMGPKRIYKTQSQIVIS